MGKGDGAFLRKPEKLIVHWLKGKPCFFAYRLANRLIKPFGAVKTVTYRRTAYGKSQQFFKGKIYLLLALAYGGGVGAKLVGKINGGGVLQVGPANLYNLTVIFGKFCKRQPQIFKGG